MSSVMREYKGKASLVQSGEGQAVRLSWEEYLARRIPPTQDFVDAVLNIEDLPEEPRQFFD